MGLPEGVSLGMVFAVLIPVAIVTVLLRAVPFSVRRSLEGSGLVKLLGVTMPVGVMLVLVVYTLAGYGVDGLLPGLLGIGFTLLLHVWLRRADVSILGGTVFYMLLVNTVF